MFTIAKMLVQWNEPIFFTPKDVKGVIFPYEDALIIFIIIFNHRVHRIQVDDSGVVDILSTKVMVQVGILSLKLMPVKKSPYWY